MTRINFQTFKNKGWFIPQLYSIQGPVNKNDKSLYLGTKLCNE